MKAFSFILVICACTFILFACKTNQRVIEHTDSVYIQKLIPVSLPADSSLVKALLQCDTNGSVLISKLSIENSKNAYLSFILDSLGNLKVETIVKHDTLYLPSDSVHINTILTEFVEVEKKLGKWDSFILRFGNWMFGGLCFIIILFVVWLILKLK